MNTTTKKLKYDYISYRKHNSREFFNAKKILKELQEKIIKYELNDTINFKLYDLFYFTDGYDYNVFYEFCDEVYNFYFMEDLQDDEGSGHGDLTELVELRQLGRTSSNWIYSSWRTWKNLTYDEVLDWTISDIEDTYSSYMTDIIYYLEELNSDLNDAIDYKKIYQYYIDNQIDIFKEWIAIQQH